MDSLLKLRDVIRLTGRSSSSIRRDIASGLFPTPVRIGGRSVAWRESDIQDWIRSLPAASLQTEKEAGQ